MTQFGRFLAAAATLFAHTTQAFIYHTNTVTYSTRETALCATRRSFFSQAIAVATVTTAASILAYSSPAWAIPSVTVSEFEEILKNSARSVQVVEFAGPKSDIVTVKLVDGTTFGLSDIIESPTDPRSPLKLVATLRGYKVPCKFMTLENALSSSTAKKKKSFANERVQLAAEKEREKAQRMAQDEAERQAELLKMQQQEAKRAAQ